MSPGFELQATFLMMFGHFSFEEITTGRPRNFHICEVSVPQPEGEIVSQILNLFLHGKDLYGQVRSNHEIQRSGTDFYQLLNSESRGPVQYL